jgi:hypothetical protein
MLLANIFHPLIDILQLVLLTRASLEGSGLII